MTRHLKTQHLTKYKDYQNELHNYIINYKVDY